MRFLATVFSFLTMLALSGVIFLYLVIQHYSADLPDYTYLKDYQPPILTRIYADDGRMMATIATEQRVFVPINVIPPLVSGAFLSAEDQNFYYHAGVDIVGIIRAALTNLKNVGRDRRPIGASTITQQVAKNMLLSNELSIARKIREVILAGRLEQSLSKDRILEIYLNEIFLGNRSYGVSQAALNYFNKSLDELTIAEAAYLAALPKAPNNYHPVRDHEAALGRRNWVIGRMQEDNRISKEDAEKAMQEPLQMRARDEAEIVRGGSYFTEEVRRQLIAQFGEKPVLEGGLAVKTSLDPALQKEATRALRRGLMDYDMRQRGWRGPVAHFDKLDGWQAKLTKIAKPAGGEEWRLALVHKLTTKEARLAFADDTRGVIPWEEMSWARKELANDQFGPDVHKPEDVLNLGDVVLVEPLAAPATAKGQTEARFALRQIPVVQGAIVALDPHTGRVFAMTGGFSDEISQYNRTTQAYRQPGSAFKPFVYMAALRKGFTPSSLVLDAPFEYVQGPGLPLWRPENYSETFYGPTPLRVGIEKSRNVMTVRLANAIGMDAVVEEAKKFGVVDDMPNLLSFSLGAKETTPLRMASAYGMIVNGGKKVTPTIIDRVQDRNGKTIWRVDNRPCEGCQTSNWVMGAETPAVPDMREQIEDPRIAYQMTSMMEGVVQRGTAKKLLSLGFPLAGKTGTTNDSRDAWFIGFTPDLVTAVYVGFDDPKPLGRKESGSSVAVPIFGEFMAAAMKNKPAIPFRIPPGLRMVKVNPETGALAPFNAKGAIWEAFIPDTEPKEGEERPLLDGSVTGEAAQGVGGAAPIVEGFPETTPEMVPAQDGGEVTAPPPVTPSTQGTGGLY
ncbi:MAG: penicillin-binding protein 1A [Alphaproteobacteria bacterium]|nr:penicillin-binding protein 1A [Alphaproteobacteria bacterium]